MAARMISPFFAFGRGSFRPTRPNYGNTNAFEKSA
jgi:hypothetical protein